MRRIDQEIKDEKYINEIINNCDCCRIGLVENNRAYIVPLNFGYICEDDKKVFYFHSAKEGKKNQLIKNSPLASFELDSSHGLKKGENACSFSFTFKSVMGTGIISIVEDEQEKVKGLNSIMNHYTGKNDWQFNEKVFMRTEVIKLVVEEMSCKENI